MISGHSKIIKTPSVLFTLAYATSRISAKLKGKINKFGWLQAPQPSESTSLQQRLVKTGGRLGKHARYYWLLLAESHLNRRRFGAILGRIALLLIPAG